MFKYLAIYFFIINTNLPTRIYSGIKNLPIPPWSRLDPLTFLGRIEQEYTLYNFDEVKKFMETAGVTTGYQYKPCLNPMDPLCPETAPNFFSKLVCITFFFVFQLPLRKEMYFSWQKNITLPGIFLKGKF